MLCKIPVLLAAIGFFGLSTATPIANDLEHAPAHLQRDVGTDEPVGVHADGLMKRAPGPCELLAAIVLVTFVAMRG